MVTSPDVLDRWADDRDSDLRAIVAFNPHTRPGCFETRAADPSSSVRANAVPNPNLIAHGPVLVTCMICGARGRPTGLRPSGAQVEQGVSGVKALMGYQVRRRCGCAERAFRRTVP
jgi:hypothetical protein